MALAVVFKWPLQCDRIRFDRRCARVRTHCHSVCMFRSLVCGLFSSSLREDPDHQGLFRLCKCPSQNPKITELTTFSKYELCNLYIVQNKRIENSTFSKQSNKYMYSLIYRFIYSLTNYFRNNISEHLPNIDDACPSDMVAHASSEPCSGIWHLESGIRNTVFGIRYPVSGNWYAVS